MQKTRGRESIYHDAGSVLRDLCDRKGSLKSLVFSLPLSLSNKKAVYALISKTLQQKSCIDDVIKQYKLLKKEPKLTYHIALVLVYDLLFTKNFKPRGPLTRSVIQHKNGLTELLRTTKETSPIEGGPSVMGCLPRYVRVNTLKVDSAYVVKKLKKLGFTEGDRAKVDEDEMVFCSDEVVPHLLVFNSSLTVSRLLTDSGLYKSFKIILQDKSSCLPAHVLAPPPESCVIDCCAAPGNKTSHAAALMNNSGIIYSFDRDKVRYDTMNDLLKREGVVCVKTFNEDFLKVKPEDYKDVEYIIVDPSCSGSGMYRRTELNNDKVVDKKRVRSLSRFQTMILKHALSFPSVQKLVYSTCSIHKEENEDVIHEALSHYDQVYQLTNILPQWTTRGLSSSPIGGHCIRVSPTTDKAQGFFLALFQRKQ